MAIVNNQNDSTLLRSNHPVALWGAVAVLAFLLFACYHLYTTIIADPAQQRAHNLAQQGAISTASLVNSFMLERQQQLASLAARPLTTAALAASEMDRQKLETSVTQLLEGAQYSQLITPLEADNNSRQLNFVALDLARRVIGGETMAPEAMLMESKWHILIATPVSTSESGEQSDSHSGCLLVSFPATRLASHLSGANAIDGQVKLIQNYEGALPRAFITLGTAEESAPKASANTKLRHWKVEFAPSLQQLKASGPEQWLFYSVLAVTVLLGIWLLGRIAFQRGSEIKAKQLDKRKRQQKEEAELAAATSFLSTIPSASKTADDAEGKKSAGTADNREVFDLTDNNKEEKAARKQTAAEAMTPEQLPEVIFRAYDIRGLYQEQITEVLATNLGLALGTLAQQRNQHSLVTAHDGRTSSPSLYRALIKGIRASGCNVIGLGQAPTPLMNFAINHLDETSSGVAVTASHNPPEYNGFKMAINGTPLTPEEIREVRTRILEQDFLSGEGEHSQLDLTADYIERIADDAVPADELNVVVDASNGVTGPIAPQLLEQMGCVVSPLHCDVDGTFPNHPPDTSVAANLQDLIQVVKHQNADLGLAFDGDGDRIVAVTGSGRIVWPDELLMIFARDVLSRQPGADIVFDVKSTRRLNALVGNYGGRPVLWKTGHSFMREKVRELDAPLGGEYSGHIFFNDRWYGFDDGMYAAARLIEIMSLREQSLDDIASTLPTGFSSNEHLVTVPEARKFSLIEELADSGNFGDCKIITLDGLRIEFSDGWGLVRASNTSAALTLRFEGSSKEEMERIRDLLKTELLRIEPSLTLDI